MMFKATSSGRDGISGGGGVGSTVVLVDMGDGWVVGNFDR